LSLLFGVSYGSHVACALMLPCIFRIICRSSWSGCGDNEKV